MSYTIEIRTLNPSFFIAYPSPPYTEIERDIKRPHTVIIFHYRNDLFICVPFRSHISHKNCYHFRFSSRSKKSRSGIDFSKTIIIKNPSFIGNISTIDNDEFSELLKYKYEIMNKINNYIEAYIMHFNGKKLLSKGEFDRKYKFTTLKYFHNLLNI